jgi:hypothetical protein
MKITGGNMQNYQIAITNRDPNEGVFEKCQGLHENSQIATWGPFTKVGGDDRCRR